MLTNEITFYILHIFIIEFRLLFIIQLGIYLLSLNY